MMKLYWFINTETMPNSIHEIRDEKVRNLLCVEKESARVSFKRTIMFVETKTLYLSIDTSLDENNHGCIIELIFMRIFLFMKSLHFLGPSVYSLYPVMSGDLRTPGFPGRPMDKRPHVVCPYVDF